MRMSFNTWKKLFERSSFRVTLLTVLLHGLICHRTLSMLIHFTLIGISTGVAQKIFISFSHRRNDFGLKCFQWYLLVGWFQTCCQLVRTVRRKDLGVKVLAWATLVGHSKSELPFLLEGQFFKVWACN